MVSRGAMVLLSRGAVRLPLRVIILPLRIMGCSVLVFSENISHQWFS